MQLMDINALLKISQMQFETTRKNNAKKAEVPIIS